VTNRRVWVRRGLVAALVGLAGEQTWRHGRDYIFADQFAVVVPGKIYRGAWQQPWPMRRVVSKYKIKTVVALAHPASHPLAVREKAMAGELGYRWVHIPIVDQRVDGDLQTISDQLEKAAAILADPRSQPVYFHCHHGINRASMVQMAYRTKFCGWTLEEASAEIEHSFGLIEVSHGPDFRHMQRFYNERVLPERTVKAPATATAAHPVTTAAARF
jgi:Tyrosine phosphatase family